MSSSTRSESVLSFRGQVLLILQRNYWTKRRKLGETLVELFFPLLFFFFLLLVQHFLPPLHSDTQLQQDVYSIDWKDSSVQNGQHIVAFAPTNASILSLMNEFASGTPYEILPFPSSSALDAFLLTSNASSVAFTLLFSLSSSASLSITLSFRPSSIPDPRYFFYSDNKNGTWQESDEWEKYVDSGFLFVQNRLSQIILSNTSAASPGVSSHPSFNFSVSEFPVSAYSQDQFHSILSSLGSLYLVIGFMPLVSRLTQSLVIEKEKKLKELMRMMGLRSAALWLGWHLTYTLIVLIPSLILSAISIAAGFYEYTPFFSIFILLFLYLQSLILLSFTLSQFFSNSRTSGSMGGMIFFILYLPNYALTSNVSKGIVYLCMLSPPIAFAQAYAAIAQGEIDGSGVVFFDHLSGGADAIVPYGSALLFIILDIFIYAFIAFYLENVLPSAYGVKKSPFFIFDSKFWCPPSASVAPTLLPDADADELKYSEDVSWEGDTQEEERERRKRLLKIRNLTKAFQLREKRGDLTVKSVVRAVNELSLDGFEGEIIGLLGPNGAGKSTTFNMLCGLIPPDSGRASIAGYDLTSSLESIHQHIGICMQDNSLFDELSIRDHLYFFGRLKGIPKGEIEAQIQQKLSEFQLEDKADSWASHLSGGQQRRLSCMIAFMGESKIIYLDEPSSGLDPASKRRLWNVILKYKKGRLLIMSTHEMNEADVLSDRIVMMSKGRIRCVGSALFLKNRFGSGYHLTLLPFSPSTSLSSALSSIGSILPYTLDRRVTSTGEISLLLPFAAADKFPAVLRLLEEKQNEFGVKTFGIAMTTMEEVFLKLAREAEGEERTREGESKSREDERQEIDQNVERVFFSQQQSNDIDQDDEKKRSAGNGNGGNGHARSPLLASVIEAPGWLQLYAILVKRYLQLRRNRRAFFFIIAYPLLFGVIVHLVSNSQDQITVTTHPPISLSFADPASGIFNAYGNTSLPWAVSSGASVQGEVSTILANTVAFQQSQLFVNSSSVDDTSLRNFLLQVEQVSIADKSQAKHIGAIFAASSVTTHLNLQLEALANNSAYHFLPFIHNQVVNSLLSSASSSSVFSSIKFISAPFSSLPEISVNWGFIETTAIFLGLAFASLPVSFAINIVRERVNGSKQLTISMGGRAHLFWLGNFLFDFVALYCLVWFLFFLLEYVLGEALLFHENFGASFLLYLSYGLTSVVYAYFVTLFFSTELSVQSVTPMIFSFGTLILYFIMSAIRSHSGGMELIRLFSILPQFSLFYSLSQLALASATRQQCEASQSNTAQYSAVSDSTDNTDNCPSIHFGVFTDDPDSLTVAPMILTLFLSGVVFALIVVVVEKRLVERFRASRREMKRKQLQAEMKKSRGESSEKSEDGNEAIGLTFNAEEMKKQQGKRSGSGEDDDVLNEHAYVEECIRRLKQSVAFDYTEAQSNFPDLILVSHLTKDYPLDSSSFSLSFSRYKRALANVSFAVKRSEIFTILGPSGAGKTSLLKVLTKEEDPSDGEAFLANYSIANGFARIFPLLGVVSQFDGLMDLMTGRETLEFYARMKGIEKQVHIDQRVETVLKWVELYKHADKLVTQYSGGMKRRLALAVALVGYKSNKLLFLDEFSTGVDPELRRQLWTVLQRVQSSHSILLTTHSMEEAEFLSSRLSILMKGRMKCIGAIQALKEKYGRGYQLEMKFKVNSSAQQTEQQRMNDVEIYLRTLFERLYIDGTVLEEFCGKWKFALNMKEKENKFPLAELFEEFEKMKGQARSEKKEDHDPCDDKTLRIELVDYSISQFSLEQIFLKMEKESDEEAVESDEIQVQAQAS